MSDTKFCFGNAEAANCEPLLYRGCGLDGIFLLNGYSIEDVDGERYISIKDLDGLHHEIGKHLVTHRKALAPKEIRFLRNTMDMTQAELATALGNNVQSVARWEKGEFEMPGPAEKLLRAIFLIKGLPDEELSKVRKLLISTLTELDMVEELTAPSAQFQLFEAWTEKCPAAA